MYPLDSVEEAGSCILTGNSSGRRVLFAKALKKKEFFASTIVRLKIVVFCIRIRSTVRSSIG
jgi:hypothetical protein